MVLEWSHCLNWKMMAVCTHREKCSVSACHQVIVIWGIVESSHPTVSTASPTSSGREVMIFSLLCRWGTWKPSCLSPCHIAHQVAEPRWGLSPPSPASLGTWCSDGQVPTFLLEMPCLKCPSSLRSLPLEHTLLPASCLQAWRWPQRAPQNLMGPRQPEGSTASHGMWEEMRTCAPKHLPHCQNAWHPFDIYRGKTIHRSVFQSADPQGRGWCLTFIFSLSRAVQGLGERERDQGRHIRSGARATTHRPCAQDGLMLHLMFCCRHLDILNNILTFHFALRPTNYVPVLRGKWSRHCCGCFCCLPGGPPCEACYVSWCLGHLIPSGFLLLPCHAPSSVPEGVGGGHHAPSVCILWGLRLPFQESFSIPWLQRMKVDFLAPKTDHWAEKEFSASKFQLNE